jgi:hypothetical protein
LDGRSGLGRLSGVIFDPTPGAIMASTDLPAVRLHELARRVTGGVEVTLFWDERTDTTTVSVWNWGSGASLQFDADPDQARHAFYHPYSYAAARGVPYQDILRVV